MSECDRCNGNGEIETDIETLACPNCEDVCQWCNNPFDDGEPLGDSGLWVCRECIRDMAAFKEQVAYQLYLTRGVENVLDNPSEFRRELGQALDDVIEQWPFDYQGSGDWIVRDMGE